MKSTLITAGLTLLVNTSALALAAETNPVNLINDTNTDMAYVMSSPGLNAPYGIKAGKTSIYHSKNWDAFTTIEVGVCKLIEDGVCVDFETLHNCVNNARYNAYHIKSIQIHSVNSCTVRCQDGSSTSCMQRG